MHAQNMGRQEQRARVSNIQKRRGVEKQHGARRKQVLLEVLNPGGGDTSQSSLKISS